MQNYNLIKISWKSVLKMCFSKMTKLKDLSVASNADANFKKGTFLCNPGVNRNVDKESIHELS